MNLGLPQYAILLSLMVSTLAVGNTTVPGISCRQGKLQVNKSYSAVDKKTQANNILAYLKELDRNIFLDHEPVWLHDDFQIKNINLASYDKTIIPQKVTDQVETRLVFQKDPADDTCFLMQQTLSDKSVKPKKVKFKKKKPARACLTTLTRGQTIFNKHVRVADQKTRQTTYPYTICTISNDDAY